MSVTAPAGFRAAGVAAGLKASGRPDVGLLVSDLPASAAGLFTTNAFAAAPVHACRGRLPSGRAGAVVVNSGQANAGTGPAGVTDAEAIAAGAAEALGITPDRVLPCSTGVIGARIPVHTALAGVAMAAANLAATEAGGDAFATAIRTTDRVSKQAAARGDGFVVGGCAKGAGMIAPDLATLLVFLTTDAVAAPDAVRHALREGAGPVWNALTIDGCSSTNDTVLLLANGSSGIAPHPDELAAVVAEASRDLALQVAADAEGATTTLVVHVDGATTDGQARTVGRAVAGSLLVKTAVFGKDPNPGRILQAIGASGASFDGLDVTATLGGFPVVDAGSMPDGFDPAAFVEALKEREVVIRIRLGNGAGTATAFGCDLGYEYVRVNSEYTT